MTLMAAKLKEAGIERDVLYLAAIEALKRSNGNIDRALELFRGALTIAARDMKIEPRGAGQGGRAMGAPTIPSRDPVTKRAAALKVATVTADVFSDFAAHYGIDLRNVQVHELPKLAKKHRVIALVAAALQRHSPNADPFAYVPDIARTTDIELFIRQAEGRNDG